VELNIITLPLVGVVEVVFVKVIAAEPAVFATVLTVPFALSATGKPAEAIAPDAVNDLDPLAEAAVVWIVASGNCTPVDTRETAI
jgi:hypothetical protein